MSFVKYFKAFGFKRDGWYRRAGVLPAPFGADFCFGKINIMNEISVHCAYSYSFIPSDDYSLVSLPVEVNVVKTKPLKNTAAILAIFGLLVLLFYLGASLVSAISLKDDWVLKSDPNFSNIGEVRIKNLSYQPQLDSSLPLGSHLSIPAIGVKTKLLEASYDNHEEALRKGVWRVGEFGTPQARALPTILVAHRFGYLSWDNTYRHLNSFYNLPKLEGGDIVEIVSGQRKYKYEVYAASEGKDIADYSADLILYTCKDLGSEVKIFRYARLLDI